MLIFLAQRRGELVTREDIASRLWADGVFVDTERGINNAIRKIRIALHDSPDGPTQLQTVVGKGYRFIGSLKCWGAQLVCSPDASLHGFRFLNNALGVTCRDRRADGD